MIEFGAARHSCKYVVSLSKTMEWFEQDKACVIHAPPPDSSILQISGLFWSSQRGIGQERKA